MNDYLTYEGYLGTVLFSAEDEVFYGEVYGINDLVTFEGKSVKELKRSFEESIDDCLECCKELGKQPDKTFKGSFNIRISTELHRKAALISTRQKISLNDFVKKAIAYAVEHEKDVDNKLVSN